MTQKPRGTGQGDVEDVPNKAAVDEPVTHAGPETSVSPDPDETHVEVWAGEDDDLAEVASKLLEASDDPEHDVQSLGGGGFRVPKAVAEKAGYSTKAQA